MDGTLALKKYDILARLQALEEGGGGGSKHEYSTEEQEVGTWIDGKKFYQKTFSFNSTAGIETSIDLTDCAIERLLNVDFHLGSQDNLQIAGGTGYFNGSGDFINGYYNENDKKYHIRYGNSYWRSETNYVTLYYTKRSEAKKRSKKEK